MTRDQNVRVLRIVTLASNSGKYGGPTDTSIRQAEIAPPGTHISVLSGALAGDGRSHPLLQTLEVRQWVPGMRYSGLFSFRLARRIVSEVGQADVVHISIARELIPIFAAFVTVLNRKPSVLQPHGMLTGQRNVFHRSVDVVVGRLIARATALIALTTVEAKQLSDRFSVPLGAMRVIGNPSQDVPATQLEAGGSRYALFAARLHPRKRVSDYVAAAAIANVELDGVTYIVAGPDQGDLPLVQDACRTYSNFAYVGALPVEELNQYIADAAVVVLASRDEPWGNVLAAAMRGGVPVVVTASSALAGEVMRLSAGYVVEDENPAQMQQAISKAAKWREEGWQPNPEVETVFGDVGIRASLGELYADATRSRSKSSGTSHGG